MATVRIEPQFNMLW